MCLKTNIKVMVSFIRYTPSVGTRKNSVLTPPPGFLQSNKINKSKRVFFLVYAIDRNLNSESCHSFHINNACLCFNDH